MTVAQSKEGGADRPPMLLMRGVSKAFGQVRVLKRGGPHACER